MNLFELTVEGHYCSGIAVVAASSKKQAITYARRSIVVFAGWDLDYSKPQQIKKLPGQYSGAGGVLARREWGD